MDDSLISARFWIAVAIAGAAGVIRGITGFGGALVMTPPLALLYGPQMAVPVVLLLEAFAATPMMRDIARAVQWRTIMPISLAACCMVPFGGYLLVTADPQDLRRAMAAIVIIFSLLLLAGWRYSGARGLPARLGLGMIGGGMLGATGMGGPPVILYLMSGPDPVSTTRANMNVHVVVTSLGALAMLGWRGILDEKCALTALLLAPVFYVGAIVGTRLFSRFSERGFRQFALILMLAVSTGILLA